MKSLWDRLLRRLAAVQIAEATEEASKKLDRAIERHEFQGKSTQAAHEQHLDTVLKREAREYLKVVNLELHRHAHWSPERLILSKVYNTLDSQMFTKKWGIRP